VMSRWASAGEEAKGLPAASAEEWFAGPLPTLRQLRRLVASLRAIDRNGRPPLGVAVRERNDGRLEVALYPVSRMDRVLSAGLRAHVLLRPGLDRETAAARQAPFYQQSRTSGTVAVVLGAGNVSGIPATDVLSKMFNDGQVCLLKLSPVNEWLGPVLAEAFQPLIRAGFLRLVYGGADTGDYLVHHPGVDAVHLTGSVATHHAIVWGGSPPAAIGHDTRPLLDAQITSELGNITPIAIVPDTYRDEELHFQARNVAAMVTNNASFNCLAGRVLITARGWPQHERFLDLLARALADTPTRDAYYPGAIERYAYMTDGRDIRTWGEPQAGQLPWTTIVGVDPTNRDDRLFRTESFCPVLAETSVGSTDINHFLAAATDFMNDTLWGSLCATIVIAPRRQRDPLIAPALDHAITTLRYGSVAINHWAALNYATVSLPWGAYPGATLADVQSGIGWVHNTFMLDGVDKAVLGGALVTKPNPPWFAGLPNAGSIAQHLTDLEGRPSWRKIPRLIAAMR